MKHQAVILDFKTKSVKYVQLRSAIKSAERVKPVRMTAEVSSPSPPKR